MALFGCITDGMFLKHSSLMVPHYRVPRNTSPCKNLATSITRIMPSSSGCAFIFDKYKRQRVRHMNCSLPQTERRWGLIVICSNKGIDLEKIISADRYLFSVWLTEPPSGGTTYGSSHRKRSWLSSFVTKWELV